MKNEKSNIKKIGKILLVCLIAVLMTSCAGQKEEPLRAVKVEMGSIKAQIPSTGIVMPRNRLEIKPPIAGRVEEVLIEEGQRVKKGLVLAWMSSNDRAALLDAARSKGEEEVKRWEDVYKPAPIVAPLNGFIIQRSVEPGQSVTASDAILVMADYLIVKAQVDETDIGSIRLGQSVEIILDAYPEQLILGKVEHIAYESKTINNVVIYEVDVLPSNVPSFFRAGMSATVNFQLTARKDVMLLPLNAVKKVGDRSYVFVKQEGKKEPQPLQIKAGVENTSHVEIIDGLKVGDQVFIPNAKMLESLQSRRHRGPTNPLQRRSE